MPCCLEEVKAHKYIDKTLKRYILKRMKMTHAVLVSYITYVFHCVVYQSAFLCIFCWSRTAATTVNVSPITNKMATMTLATTAVTGF